MYSYSSLTKRSLIKITFTITIILLGVKVFGGTKYNCTIIYLKKKTYEVEHGADFILAQTVESRHLKYMGKCNRQERAGLLSR